MMGTTLLPLFATAGEHRDQAMAALAEANRVRLRRASLMRWMHGGSAAESHGRAAELILEPDPALYPMLPLELLQRVHRVGTDTGRTTARVPDVSPTSTLRALMARQRAGLAALLRLRADQLSPRNRRKTAR